MLRRMADRRRRRALPNGTEREGGIEAVCEIPLTTEKLRGGDVVVERRWNGATAAAASELELAADAS